MADAVLDASALLAFLNDEPGAETVAEALPGAVISALNLSEVVAKLSGGGMPENAVRQALAPLGLAVIPFDEAAQAYEAGFLRSATMGAGLPLGDRGCLGLARQMALPALTADRTWLELRLGIEIKTMR